jgi:hypothetical protein
MMQQLVLALLFAQAFCLDYKLEIVTGSKKYDGTDGTFYGSVIGKKGRVDLGVLDNWGDDFQVGAIDEFSVDSDKSVGKFDCVEITADSDDAWMIDYIIVSIGDSKTWVYNTEGRYMSTDAGEGDSVKQFCKQGDATYIFEITTANEKWAGTDNIHARLTVSSKGNKGNTTTGYLDNQGIDDFVVGATDTFILPNLKNVGKAGCVWLTAEQDDAWLFESITVTRGKMSKTFENKDGVWLSSDLSEGVDELEICN